MNKKFILIEILFLVIPIVVASINAAYSNLSNFPWGNDHINEISLSAFAVAILGNIYIALRSAKYGNKSWKIVSIVFIVILTLLFFIGYSISNFGF